MIDKKPTLRLFYVCLLMGLGSLGLHAAGAQAAKWKESGANTATTLTFIGEADSTEWVFDTAVAGTPIKILCTTLTVTEGNLFAAGNGLAKLSFSTCQTLVNNIVDGNCEPVEPIAMKVEISQFLHSARDYLLLVPDGGGEIFTTVQLTKAGVGCTIGEQFNIKGHMVFEDCENRARTEQVRHLVQNYAETVSPLFNTATSTHKNDLKFGANAMTLLGSEWLKLVTGNNWSFNAE